MTIVNGRAFLGIRHFERLGEFARALQMEDVRRAGQHRLILLTIIQVKQRQTIRVGMRVHFTDLSNHDLVAVPANAAGLEFVAVAIFVRRHRQPRILDLIHFESGKSQLAGNFFYR